MDNEEGRLGTASGTAQNPGTADNPDTTFPFPGTVMGAAIALLQARNTAPLKVRPDGGRGQAVDADCPVCRSPASFEASCPDGLPNVVHPNCDPGEGNGCGDARLYKVMGLTRPSEKYEDHLTTNPTDEYAKGEPGFELIAERALDRVSYRAREVSDAHADARARARARAEARAVNAVNPFRARS